MSSSESLDISVVIVTSPAPSMPSTELISSSIESFQLIRGLEACRVIIVMDGIELSAVNRTKKGRITSEMLALYDEYHEQLKIEFSDPRFEIFRCEKRQGFAYAVHLGLTRCTSKYAIVVQHDRVFATPFTRLPDLINHMETHDHVRYIGFPTSSNVCHDKLLISSLSLGILNSEHHKYCLQDDLYLQPLAFWFDSNHLCHVERYLEIFRPISHLPPDLKARIGMKDMKKLVLRPGDFIEDRFGQMQRILLSAAGAAANATATGSSRDSEVTQELDAYTVRLFRWFGSYLCWHTTAEDPYHPEYATSKCLPTVMVRHLKGRQLNPKWVMEVRERNRLELLQQQQQGTNSNTTAESSEVEQEIYLGAAEDVYSDREGDFEQEEEED